MIPESITQKRTPGIPDRALIKAATNSNAVCSVAWILDSENNKFTRLTIGDDVYTAPNNTILITILIDTLAERDLEKSAK